MKKIALILVIVCILLTFVGLSSCKPQRIWDVDTIDDNYRVFYQIFVGSFSDSNGDGTGDLRGIINRIDYLNDGNVNSQNSLGVQGIWLSPIFESSTYHKYDARNFYKIDPKFGTEDDLKELLELCHQRNVKVILDLAINHTAMRNQWFLDFVTAQQNNDTENKYYDFYTNVNADGRLNGHEYYKIPGCDNKYYEGNFSSSMPELNYDNPDVRQAVLDVAKYYLNLGVDGFRFDAIKYIYYNDTARSAEFWQWYMEELRKEKPDIYCVGECWSADNEILSYYSAMNCFSFDAAQVSGTIAGAARNGQVDVFTKHVASFTQRACEINPDSMFIPFIANHDTNRAAGYLPLSQDANDSSLRYPAFMAANIYLLCSGSPFIYYGEEIGMKGLRGSEQTDANRRLAMLWGDKDKVADPEGATFEKSKQINGTVKSQLKDPDSLLHYYIKVIKLRNKYPQIARGQYTAVTAASNCAGFVIEYNGEKTLLLHNASTKDLTIDLTKLGAFATLCDFIGMGDASVQGSTLTLKAQTSAILK